MLYPLCLLFEIPWPAPPSLPAHFGLWKLPCITCCYCFDCVSLTLASPYQRLERLRVAWIFFIIFPRRELPPVMPVVVPVPACLPYAHYVSRVCFLFSSRWSITELKHIVAAAGFQVQLFRKLGQWMAIWKKRSLWIAFLSFYYDSLNSKTKDVFSKYSRSLEMVGKNVLEIPSVKFWKTFD